MPPKQIRVSAGDEKTRLMSVDVECVANGRGHNDRVVAHIAVVDGASEGDVVNVLIKQEKPIVSYLTPITGLTKRDFEDGKRPVLPLKDAVALVKESLGPDVILVGQAIQNDIEWLKLKKGIDYKDSIDLAECFKTYNPRYRNHSFFSLAAEATILLGVDMEGAHDPSQDARFSLQLYKKFVLKGGRTLEEAKKKLLKTRKPMSVAKRLDYQCDGVCMAKFFRKKCICGQHGD